MRRCVAVVRSKTTKPSVVLRKRAVRVRERGPCGKAAAARRSEAGRRWPDARGEARWRTAKSVRNAALREVQAGESSSQASLTNGETPTAGEG